MEEGYRHKHEIFPQLTIRCSQNSLLSPYKSVRIKQLCVKICSIVQITSAIIRRIAFVF